MVCHLEKPPVAAGVGKLLPDSDFLGSEINQGYIAQYSGHDRKYIARRAPGEGLARCCLLEFEVIALDAPVGRKVLFGTLESYRFGLAAGDDTA